MWPWREGWEKREKRTPTGCIPLPPVSYLSTPPYNLAYVGGRGGGEEGGEREGRVMRAVERLFRQTFYSRHAVKLIPFLLLHQKWK